jgi:TRAP-type C4-dicarboxylate transport system permease large subunit
MSSLTMGALIALMGMALFMTGMPIAFALGLTAIISIFLFLEPSELELYGKFLYDSVNDFGLLAIPLFVLMGNLFGGSTASAQLFAAGEAWLSKVRGGLGMSSVLACSVFAALTGSSPATSAAIGRIAIPGMRERGYSSRVAAGAIAAGGTLGILIPPSITLILYGIAAEVSIGQLFAAGIIPGIIVTLLFCTWILIAVTLEQRRDAREPALATVGAGAAADGGTTETVERGSSSGGTSTPNSRRATTPRYEIPEYTWSQRFAALVKVLPFLALIFAILGVLYAGIATPSEAAAVGVVLVLFLIGVVYRGLRFKQFLHVLLETTNQSTMILLITAFSAVIATVLSFLSVPQDLAQMVTELEVNKWVIMIVINIFLLVLGLFLPPVSIIVMVTPVLYPLIIGLGFDPVWFGIIMTLNMEMGLITPPVGLNLYVIKGIAPDIPLREILIGTLPYVGVLAVGIVILSVFPGIVTWLPQLLY